jgi:hypothetical protein
MQLGNTLGITNGVVVSSTQVALHVLHGDRRSGVVFGALTDSAVSFNPGNGVPFIVGWQKNIMTFA